MILIDGKFEVSSSLSFVLYNTSTVLKADGIIMLGFCIILIDSQFVISSSFSIILHNTSFVRQAKCITSLG
jgi:hypothetical protein